MNRIYFTVMGDGKPVFLVHGLAASLKDWDRITPPLAKAGLRVYALDLPGHGDSYQSEQASEYTTLEYYKQLSDWIHSLDLAQPAAVVGHSLGGLLSLMLAARDGMLIDRMVLIAPYYDPGQLSRLLRLARQYPALAANGLRWTPARLLRLFTRLPARRMNGLSEPVRDQMTADLKRASHNIFRLPRSFPSMNSELKDIRIPVKVIWGEADHTLNPQFFPQLVKALPNAQGMAIPGVDHQPHLERPEIVSQAIIEFLK